MDIQVYRIHDHCYQMLPKSLAYIVNRPDHYQRCVHTSNDILAYATATRHTSRACARARAYHSIAVSVY